MTGVSSSSNVLVVQLAINLHRIRLSVSLVSAHLLEIARYVSVQLYATSVDLAISLRGLNVCVLVVAIKTVYTATYRELV